MSNRLIRESSPYLLQHASNPVDWYPWGEEAFLRAKREDKPIFLSIGYSTCHWCHVMAHESFENREIANILNDHFISIKVDREERPDIDSVYMTVCQAFTGSGGWPASIFMTPEKMPFWAGTYYPPVSRYGMVGFGDLLRAIHQKWTKDRELLLTSARQVADALQKNSQTALSDLDPSLPEQAENQFAQSFDAQYGGFGQAPKFPMPHQLLFLLARSQLSGSKGALAMAQVTLTQMRKGGLFDHIGYGFSRYSTDRSYLVPHFEKMLYDNALLMLAYTAAYTVDHNPLFLDTAQQTADFVLRELTSPEGGFYSALDADSDGVEGKYYLLGYDEVLQVLGKESGQHFNRAYGITPRGNFEGQNIPNRLHSKTAVGPYPDSLLQLREYRKARASLHLDDKVLTSWNGLTIAALAFLYRVTGEELYLHAAQRGREFINTHLRRGTSLFAGFRAGKKGAPGFLDDYAFYTAALLALYDATGEHTLLEEAEDLCRETIRQFEDRRKGGFFLSGKNHEALLFNPKDYADTALPSGNSVMALNLTRLSQITGKEEWTHAAEEQLKNLAGPAKEYPMGYSLSLLALLLYQNPPPRITVVPSPEANPSVIQKSLPLYSVSTMLQGPNSQYPLLNGKTTYYICKGRTCLPPTNSPVFPV